MNEALCSFTSNRVIERECAQHINCVLCVYLQLSWESLFDAISDCGFPLEIYPPQ